VSGHAQPGEYEDEPIRGLPGVPPEGEEILWQGSPSARGLALRAFHVRKVAAWFALLLAWSIASSLTGAAPFAQAAWSAARLVLLALVATGILAGIAWLNARATVYTITTRRIVMRFGVALTMAVNLPFRVVRSAELRTHPDGTGDVSLAVSGAGRLGYLMLWPFARPWRFGADAQPAVAERLRRALEASAPTEEALAEPEQRPTRSERERFATAAA